MTTSLEELIVFHCAPVIRDLKVANLVAIPSVWREEFHKAIQEYNEKFNECDLYFYELCHCRERCLLLVFRKSKLEAYLKNTSNLSFLKSYGYEVDKTLDTWLKCLRTRLEEGDTFPHEIGLFLGYPLQDVIGFITYNGGNYLICGEWKVYSNKISAMQSFQCYRTCRDYCLAKYRQGNSLKQLVA